MEKKDDTGNSPLRHPIGHTQRLIRAGHRHIVGIGFSAAVVVISLAGVYAVYGGSSDRELNTGNSNSQQIQKDTAESKEANPMTSEEQAQPQADSAQGGQAGNSTSTKTEVTVNGQRVEVPTNGNIDTTINTGDGQTRVKVDSQQSSTSSTGSNGGAAHNSSSSSVKLNVTSESNSQ